MHYRQILEKIAKENNLPLDLVSSVFESEFDFICKKIKEIKQTGIFYKDLHTIKHVFVLPLICKLKYKPVKELGNVYKNKKAKAAIHNSSSDE